MEKLKCPEIRFGGFGGDWDEGTFGSSLAFLQSGKSKERSDFGKFPFYGSTGTIGYSETFDYSGASILVARVGANAGTLYAVAGNYSVSDNTLIIKLKDGNEYVFFSNLLERFNLNKLVFGSGQPLITGGHLKAINVAIPPLQEQIQIGTFLQNFDQAIALRERKYTQTQNLKKAMLEKMFPKAGSKQPEIRIKGFGGDWEEQPLENIFGKIRNAFVGTSTPYYVKSGNFYLESNNVKDGQINRKSEIFINDYFYSKQQDKWLKTNDIVMVQSGHVGHSAVISEELNNSAAHALIIFSDYKVEANPHFINYQLQTDNAKMAIEKITTGNTIKHILSSDMKRFVLLFTCPKEQTAIGQFFKQLDDTLALQQQQLQTLKNLKHAFLAKMFV